MITTPQVWSNPNTILPDDADNTVHLTNGNVLVWGRSSVFSLGGFPDFAQLTDGFGNTLGPAFNIRSTPTGEIEDIIALPGGGFATLRDPGLIGGTQFFLETYDASGSLVSSSTLDAANVVSVNIDASNFGRLSIGSDGTVLVTATATDVGTFSNADYVIGWTLDTNTLSLPFIMDDNGAIGFNANAEDPDSG